MHVIGNPVKHYLGAEIIDRDTVLSVIVNTQYRSRVKVKVKQIMPLFPNTSFDVLL